MVQQAHPREQRCESEKMPYLAVEEQTMPGIRSTRRDTADYALARIRSEELAPVADRITEVVNAVSALGSCLYADPNKTRAIALVAKDEEKGKENQFFAIYTQKRKSSNPSVGMLGFNVQVAIRDGFDQQPSSRWFEAFHDTGTTKWWHFRPTKLDSAEINEIVGAAKKARESFQVPSPRSP